MSVIRRPGVLGRTTHQRVVGVTAALSTATVDAIAVGTWFALVVVQARTTATALVGLAVLLVGATIRVRVFGAAIDAGRSTGRPGRLVLAIGLTACWIGWLLVAELVGGVGGVVAAATGLTVLLAAQYHLEWWCFETGGFAERPIAVGTFVPSLLVALGATALLGSVWFVDWTVATAPLSVAGRSAVLEVGAFSVGFAAFVVCSFLGHQRRFQRTLAS